MGLRFYNMLLFQQLLKALYTCNIHRLMAEASMRGVTCSSEQFGNVHPKCCAVIFLYSGTHTYNHTPKPSEAVKDASTHTAGAGHQTINCIIIFSLTSRAPFFILLVLFSRYLSQTTCCIPECCCQH